MSDARNTDAVAAVNAAVTPFQRRVYAALCEVPRGRVTTYGLLAARIGCGSARAVGGALRRNPDAPHVPCHRVIAADGTAGGFQGATQGTAIRRKLARLRAEGVAFDAAGRLRDPARILRFGRRPIQDGDASEPEAVPEAISKPG